ncbi:hypothetical protein Mal64_07020 [Pseudobythopirellula maris]|uniref:Carboxypeptidase regulatory-like domain-containing protein n=1 Tax=Pseudobythopirellula maris TaxID=2527991 RepID=A0A5C5ZTD6_9BACT|nr:hypothetical protein [Pseudobythopirellula maris]TWT90317.1 hypothetical protein Mal64_07020 [Pseudobythopirellula maris]
MRSNTDGISDRATLRSTGQLGASVAALLVAGILASAGCDDGRPPRYPVRGKVEFVGGGTVRHATIEFVPTTPGPSPRGKVDAAGNFRLGTYDDADGAPAGKYQVVVIQPMPPVSPTAADQLGEEHASHAASFKVVHLKHASPSTSGLTAEVEATGKNEMTIVVEAN